MIESVKHCLKCESLYKITRARKLNQCNQHCTVCILGLPSVNIQVEETDIKENSTFTLTCTASGQTPLNYQWFFTNKFNGQEELLTNRQAFLTVKNASYLDAGRYRCEVTAGGDGTVAIAADDSVDVNVTCKLYSYSNIS